MRRVAALAPVLPLTAAWTLLLSEPAATPGAGVALLPLAVTEPEPAVDYPEVTTISAPETAGGSSTLATTPVDDARTVVDDIPDVALAAYQRAATVANAADRGCRVPWELVAAVGRVESNHGRFGGSHLDDDGVATPEILGLRLDGRPGTTRVADTDAGELDGDQRFDRAVGPMQFIPGTWAYVGVDADGDGIRDPQDIDDAALSAAVYLCAGGDDLSVDAGQRRAVHRYNHSASYVEMVLAIMRSYQRDDLWTVPGVVPGPVVTYDPTPPPPEPAPELHTSVSEPVTVHEESPTPSPTPSPSPSPSPTPSPSPSPEPTPEPSADPSTSPSADPSESPQPSDDPSPSASPAPTDDPSLPTPEEQAAALCEEVGLPADLTCLELALDGSDAPGWVVPTAEELLARLENQSPGEAGGPEGQSVSVRYGSSGRYPSSTARRRTSTQKASASAI